MCSCWNLTSLRGERNWTLRSIHYFQARRRGIRAEATGPVTTQEEALVIMTSCRIGTVYKCRVALSAASEHMDGGITDSKMPWWDTSGHSTLFQHVPKMTRTPHLSCLATQQSHRPTPSYLRTRGQRQQGFTRGAKKNKGGARSLLSARPCNSNQEMIIHPS